jgi:2-methylisocitrate lyase-like PEP mutase family enzyme
MLTDSLTMEAAQKAERFRALHEAPELLVLANVWDVASAQAVAEQPGCQALATASHSIAASHGYEDGEHLPLELMLAAVERIAAATDLPVSADLERGFGATPDDVAETMRRAIAAGAVGCNLEDGMPPGDGDPLRALDDAVARVEATVAAGRDAGVPLVVNARTDALARGVPDAIDVAVERGRAYLGAGADVVFVPGAVRVDDVRRLVDGIGAVSVVALPGMPPLRELQDLGVRRVSFGPGLQRVALAAVGRAAARVLSLEGYPKGY